MMTRSITYYSRQIIYLDKLINKEDNRFIKYLYNILKKYYTHKWEVYYDEEEKKSYKTKKKRISRIN